MVGIEEEFITVYLVLSVLANLYDLFFLQIHIPYIV